MEILGRADEPWDAIFAFHFLAEASSEHIPSDLEKMIAQETATGIDFERPVTSQNDAKNSWILGCFLTQETCVELLNAWNEPEGDDSWMCYFPNHGIATIRGGQLDWWALICFYCSNAGVGGVSAKVDNPSVPNRILPTGALLERELLRLLPHRTFPVREG